MTLIVTAITKFGIVHASDSNLTVGMGASTREGTKLFRLGFADAALALAGCYVVAGKLMDTWMPQAIADYIANGSPTLEGFAHHLAAQLDAEMTPQNKKVGNLIHIAGYVDDANGAHPEMWFVRNIEGIDRVTGAYTEERSAKFMVTEDFWRRDHAEAKGRWSDRGYQIYFNGTPSGRISYLGAHYALEGFFEGVWNNPAWRFRAPRTLREWSAIVRLEVNAVTTLFIASDYSAPPIGGDVQIEEFPPPAGAVAL